MPPLRLFTARSLLGALLLAVAFIETSAREAQNVGHAFIALARNIKRAVSVGRLRATTKNKGLRWQTDTVELAPAKLTGDSFLWNMCTVL